MPDHLHLLLSPSNTTSIVAFIQAYKSFAARLAMDHGLGGRIWQQGFFDHFLRREEDAQVAVRYILGNPVRRGLVGEWREYQFGGSLVYEL